MTANVKESGEVLTLDQKLENFGHVAASTSGTATFCDIGNDKFNPGVKLVIDATVVPAVGRRGNTPEFLRIEFSESQSPGEIIEPRRLVTQIPVWVEGVEAAGLRSLFMALGASAADKRLLSLAEFAPKIWQNPSRKTDYSGKGSELLVLDTLAQILFALAAQLHSRGRTIGLIDPANVLFFFSDNAIQINNTAAEPVRRQTRNSVSESREGQDVSSVPRQPNFAGIQVLLPDLYLDSDVNVTDVPPWLSVRADYRFLWDAEQSKDDAKGAGEKLYLDNQVKRCSPHKDVKSLARMFAWALTGKKMDHVPADIYLRGACWDEFRKVLTPVGQPAGLSAAELGNSLANRPLREHLQSPSADSERPRKSTVGAQLLFGGALLLVAGFLAFCFLPREKPLEPVIYSGCPDCDPDSQLHPLFTTQLSPLIAKFHAEDRYRFPEDGSAVLEPQFLDAEAIRDQTRLLLEQLKVLKKAQALVADKPTKDLASEENCLTSELRAAMARVNQHFDVVDHRTVAAMDGKLLAIDSVRILRSLLEAVESANNDQIRRDVEKTRKFLQTEDSDTRQLFTSDARFAPFFSYAASFCDSDRAKRFLIRHVRKYHLQELQELEL